MSVLLVSGLCGSPYGAPVRTHVWETHCLSLAYRSVYSPNLTDLTASGLNINL